MTWLRARAASSSRPGALDLAQDGVLGLGVEVDEVGAVRAGGGVQRRDAGDVAFPEGSMRCCQASSRRPVRVSKPLPSGVA